MKKIAVIGPKSLVLGFGAFGVETFFADSGDECLNTLKDIKTQNQHSVVFIVKDLIDEIPEAEYKKVSSSHLPAILAIPGLKFKDEEYVLKLKKLAEKAIGSDILK